MRKHFRQEIPDELVYRLLSVCGWRSLNDTREAIYRPSEANSVLTEVYPYYVPVYARRFCKADPDLREYITIVRQVLRVRGLQIYTREKSRGGRSYTKYYLNLKEPIVVPQQSNNFSVSFN